MAPRPYTNTSVLHNGEEIPGNLIERIAGQKGRDKLDLSLCNLKSIPLDWIKDYYGHITNLDLSYNTIQYVSPKFTAELLDITILDLSRNEIRKLPDNFGDLRKLVYLDLFQNQLETLPVSMGELARLQYIRISENPLRAPLKDFLGQKGRNLSGVALAEHITTFLREVAEAHEQLPTSDVADTSRSRPKIRPSKIHYRKRSRSANNADSAEKVVEQEVVSSSESEMEADVNHNVPEKAPALTFGQTLAKVGKIAVLAAIWMVIIPILIAYVMDTSYLENLVKGTPYLETFWTDYYRHVHEMALPVANLIPKVCSVFLYGPKEVETSLLQKMFFFGSSKL